MTPDHPPEYEPNDEPDKDYEMTSHYIAHCEECGALPPGIGGSTGCKPSCTHNDQPHVNPDLMLAVLDALRERISTPTAAYRIGAICGMYSGDMGLNARSVFDLAVYELNQRQMLTPEESEHAAELITALWADPA
jgi:hypothetical protein